MFLIEPPAVTFALYVNVAVPFLAIEAILPVIMPALIVTPVPPETKLNPAGSLSDTSTFVAASGPAFLTEMV